jgi:hypothetical protein
MKRLVSFFAAIAIALMFAAAPALAQSDEARIRVIHASPDAPAVDVLVNDAAAFTNAPFTGITDYAALSADTYNIKVVPAGATEPVVIEADLALAAGTDYSVVAVGELANIEPLVLVDNNSAPAAGMAHVRFVHASPDAPAVDVAVTGGPVLFGNIAFKGTGDYTPVAAGAYDLEVRLAGTDTVALPVPGVQLNAGTVYTIFAMGLAGGTPALAAVPSVDATPGTMAPAPATPPQLPATGEPSSLNSVLLALGLVFVMSGAALSLRRRLA